MIWKSIELLCFFCFLFYGEVRAQDPVMLLAFPELVAVPEQVRHQALQGNLSGILKEAHGQKVSIRGFMYRTKDERIVLAAEPNLKSCCIGNTAQVERQIEVQELTGPVADNGRVVTLQGIFSVSPVQSNDGTLQRLYVLKNAHFGEERLESSGLIFVLAGFVILAVFVYFLYVGKQKSK